MLYLLEGSHCVVHSGKVCLMSVSMFSFLRMEYLHKLLGNFSTAEISSSSFLSAFISVWTPVSFNVKFLNGGIRKFPLFSCYWKILWMKINQWLEFFYISTSSFHSVFCVSTGFSFEGLVDTSHVSEQMLLFFFCHSLSSARWFCPGPQVIGFALFSASLFLMRDNVFMVGPYDEKVEVI